MYVGRQAPDFNPFKNNKENEKKGKVSSLLRQQRSLEEIKQRGIPKIKAFISTSFNVPEECIETSDIVFNKCWSFTVASVTFNYEGEIKNKSFNIRETLYTSYKNAYAMTQEIKNYFNLKRKNMIPNIKSSEGIGDGVQKVIHGLRVYHVQRASGNPVRIPVQIISQRNCIQLPRFCH
jgi:hypothetical protein